MIIKKLGVRILKKKISLERRNYTRKNELYFVIRNQYYFSVRPFPYLQCKPEIISVHELWVPHESQLNLFTEEHKRRRHYFRSPHRPNYTQHSIICTHTWHSNIPTHGAEFSKPDSCLVGYTRTYVSLQAQNDLW